MFSTISSTAIRDFVKIHFQDFLFRKEEFNFNSEDEFFDFPLKGALRGEKGVFNELLGDGGAALEFLIKNDLLEGAKDAFPGNTIMFKELTVFNG